MELEIKQLTTGYDNKIIIEDLNIAIPLGKVTTLIGGNGCGKSTLLKTICRIIKPVSGEVILDGKAIHTMDTKVLAKQLAILPQSPTAPGTLTVKELISYGRAPHRSGFLARLSEEDKEIVQWALEVTDLQEYADRPIKNLSGGQRQRAWIAMAIAQDTDILFLDEPTSYLDISHQMEVLELVQELNEKYGKTVIMVLHELNQVSRYSDYIIAMKKGEIRFSGTPFDVFTNEMLEDIFGIDSIILNDPRNNRPYCVAYTKKSQAVAQDKVKNKDKDKDIPTDAPTTILCDDSIHGSEGTLESKDGESP